MSAGTRTGDRVLPRPVFCVIAERHRDLAVAEDACRGRFANGGVVLDLGPSPDWLAGGLPDDEEWRIEWSKFSFGLDLAHAFATTGEERFLRAWEDLVERWIEQVPVGHDRSEVLARRVTNWVYAWAAFAAAPAFDGLSDGLAERLLASIDEQAWHLHGHLSAERNHRTLELHGLLVVALALPELDPAGRRLAFALSGLAQNLADDVLDDGVHRERSSHYHLMVLRSFLSARENARRFGVAVPPGYDERLAAACRFAMHLQRPDGEIPALSDADGGAYPDVLALAADLLDRADLRYVATAGAEGEAPAERNATFPAGGYAVQRSGWGRDDRFLILDCGPLGDGGHGHYDLLSLEVYGAGRPLVVDPGRYTYSESAPNWRRWFKGTGAHSTVSVDGLDQQPYRRGKPKGEQAGARLVERVSVDGLDVVRAEALSPAYEARHERTVVFVDEAYWLVVDRLVGAIPHRYVVRFQLAPEAEGAARADGAVVSAPGLALVFDEAHTPSLEAGWVSRRYGLKEPAPAATAVAEGEPCATFATVVAPLAAGERAPRLRRLAEEAWEIAGTGPRGHGRRDVVELGPAVRRLAGGAS